MLQLLYYVARLSVGIIDEYETIGNCSESVIANERSLRVKQSRRGPGQVDSSKESFTKEQTMDLHFLQNMFVLGLPVIEKILRPVLVYAFLVIGLRLAGKRELAQLNPFDLVVLLTLSNTVQNAIIGDDNSVTGGVIGAATLLIVNYLVVRFLYHNHKLEEVVEGKEIYLIRDGKIVQEAMEGELVTLEELRAAARKQGYVSLDDIESAVLEPEGAMSFITHIPAPEEQRHRELLDRIDALGREVNQLKQELGKANPG